MEENRKPLSEKELWCLLVSAGAISPDSFEEEKVIAITCEKVIGLLARHQGMKDQSMFDAMSIFSHLRKCESCRKEYKKYKDESEQVKQEQIIQENPTLPERCKDWERHEHALNLDPGKWTSDTKYVFPKCADNKACCIHWLKLVMGTLANSDMRILLFWIQWRKVADEQETEVIMEIMTDILSKKDRHKVMITIIDKYYDTKEDWESWVICGKSYRGQSGHLLMEECKKRLSKAFGLTDDALKMYEAARKKRVKWLAVRKNTDTIKKDKGFFLPQVCNDISSHGLEYGSIFILSESSWFDKKICCRHNLKLTLEKLLRNEGLEDYINYIISMKRILKFRPKQLRIYLGTAIKILKECDHNKVMECLGKLYNETGLKLQENARELNKPAPEDTFDAIFYRDKKEGFFENKNRLSVSTRLIRKLALR